MYHIVKSSRCYDGRGYEGPACARAGVEPGKSYLDVNEAFADADSMSRCNPVGFEVWDSVTGMKVERMRIEPEEF